MPIAQTADDVDDENQDTGDCIATYELAGPIHSPVKVRLLSDFFAAASSVVLIDDTGIEISIDGHLLTGHGIEGKARTYLGDSSRALGYYYEVDDHQNDEHNEADHIVPTDEDFPEGLDNPAGSSPTLMALQEHNTRRRDVQRQPQQRRDQQNGRKGGKFQGLST